MTVSLGIATFDPDAPEPLHSLLTRADQALLASKRSGRNRVAAGCRCHRNPWKPEIRFFRHPGLRAAISTRSHLTRKAREIPDIAGAIPG